LPLPVLYRVIIVLVAWILQAFGRLLAYDPVQCLAWTLETVNIQAVLLMLNKLMTVSRVEHGSATNVCNPCSLTIWFFDRGTRSLHNVLECGAWAKLCTAQLRQGLHRALHFHKYFLSLKTLSQNLTLPPCSEYHELKTEGEGVFLDSVFQAGKHSSSIIRRELYANRTKKMSNTENVFRNNKHRDLEEQAQ
jgi:hypothetical protein